MDEKELGFLMQIEIIYRNHLDATQWLCRGLSFEKFEVFGLIRMERQGSKRETQMKRDKIRAFQNVDTE